MCDFVSKEAEARIGLGTRSEIKRKGVDVKNQAYYLRNDSHPTIKTSR
jgi:hypothetical protein